MCVSLSGVMLCLGYQGPLVHQTFSMGVLFLLFQIYYLTRKSMYESVSLLDRDILLGISIIHYSIDSV